MSSTHVFRPVVFAGENPGLTLHQAGGDAITVAASYWRCTYSAHGEGNVLVIWAAPEASGLAAALAAPAIYADNPQVARLVTDRFTQYFGSFRDRGFASVEPQHARFFQQGDGVRLHRVACTTDDDTTFELVWRDVRDAQFLRAPNDFGGTRYEVNTVICPCAGASVLVNGAAIPGEVRLTEGERGLSSSAFLAFAESWIETQPGE